MKEKKKYLIAWFIFISFLTISCVEPFHVETKTYESALVIEATITNEFKYQEINLTRSFQFEENGPQAESNADVIIKDDTQNIYKFRENAPGSYISDSKFSAEPNKNYQLLIMTNDGRSYASQTTQFTKITQIDDVFVLKEGSDNALEDFNIYVDSFDPFGESRYYRYEYEETYQIIAPYWSPLEAIVISDVPPYQIDLNLKNREEQVCYKTSYSTTIIQTESTGFTEDRISKFLVKRIPVDDFSVSHRYSILVKQYIQSLESYTFYKTMHKFSKNESLFSQNQPGFFEGNVYAVDDLDEIVLGFFDVSSVASKRLFFNYRDFITSGRPPYPEDCYISAPPLTARYSPKDSPLISNIKNGYLKFYKMNDNVGEDYPGPYLMVRKACGDCNELGDNKRPEFWID